MTKKTVVISEAVPPDLRLYIPHVADSYGGRLYFILGPGLGDTVNDLRILHEVMKLYAKSEPVVYVDTRWRALCQEIPDLRDLTIRYHEEAPSPMSNSKQSLKPYHQTFNGIIEEIIAESTNSPGRVALGGFKCADRLARKELNIEMKARAIGLSLPPERCRPFFPLKEEYRESAARFLKQCGISAGSYVVIAPYTAEEKMWSHDAWESLITLLHRFTEVPVLVVGDRGDASFGGAKVHKAIGLPLTLIAGLLSQARCFVGLDSGPTHLAACFDIPVVTLNPQGKFPPFLVESHSPYRWTHLTPGVYGDEPILSESVLEIIQRSLSLPAPSRCPLCMGFPYILGAKRGRILYLCRCGLIFCDVKEKRRESPSMLPIPGEVALPNSRGALPSLLASLAMDRGEVRHPSNSGSITLTFEHWSPLEFDPDKLLSSAGSRDLWWTWDGVYALLSERGWQISDSSIGAPASNSGALFSVVVKATPRSGVEHDVYLRMPWGRKIVRIRRSMYEEWLSWESFQKLDELEGLGWQLANEGWVKDGREILRLAFALGPRPRTIERLFRVECRSVWNGLVRR